MKSRANTHDVASSRQAFTDTIYSNSVLCEGKTALYLARSFSLFVCLGPDLSLPNNGQDVRTARTGVILDEIGLDLLAKELAAQVLLPVGGLTHPEWTRGATGLDSYHAFSIHVAPVTAELLEKNDRSSPPAQQWKAEDDSSSNDAPDLRGHIDICEISMNICIGETALLHQDSRPNVLAKAILMWRCHRR